MSSQELLSNINLVITTRWIDSCVPRGESPRTTFCSFPLLPPRRRHARSLPLRCRHHRCQAATSLCRGAFIFVSDSATCFHCLHRLFECNTHRLLVLTRKHISGSNTKTRFCVHLLDCTDFWNAQITVYLSRQGNTFPCQTRKHVSKSILLTAQIF